VETVALSLTGLRPGDSVLDVAGGTGDMAVGLARQVGRSGLVVLTDINAAMLAGGPRPAHRRRARRQRVLRAGGCRAAAFADASFECVTIAFGLRNVTDKARALASMRRVLKSGGQLLVLEFSKPTTPSLQALYDAYSLRVLPLMGRLVAGDADSYRYLAESDPPPPGPESLLAMLREAGLENCRYHNLLGGIVAVHRGYRI